MQKWDVLGERGRASTALHMTPLILNDLPLLPSAAEVNEWRIERAAVAFQVAQAKEIEPAKTELANKIGL
jgi:hypothetical protein